MEMPWQCVGSYDVRVQSRQAVVSLGCSQETLFFGQRGGNVCDVPLGSLDISADGLVSGPPCPPYSTMGQRLGTADPRANVFLIVAKWILHLVRYGSLRFFVVENASGIAKRKRGESD